MFGRCILAVYISGILFICIINTSSVHTHRIIKHQYPHQNLAWYPSPSTHSTSTTSTLPSPLLIPSRPPPTSLLNSSKNSHLHLPGPKTPSFLAARSAQILYPTTAARTALSFHSSSSNASCWEKERGSWMIRATAREEAMMEEREQPVY